MCLSVQLKPVFMRRVLAVLLLLVIGTMSPVNAAPGGVIALNSVEVSGHGEIGNGSVLVNFSVQAVENPVEALISWQVQLDDLEGQELFKKSDTIYLNGSESSLISVEVTSVPIGYSNVSIQLTGDVGTPQAEQGIEWWQILQRLRPIDLGLNGILIEPVLDNGSVTGNSTIRSGDQVQLSADVQNEGDVNWTGGLIGVLDGIEAYNSTMSIEAQGATTVSFVVENLTEGDHQLIWIIQEPDDLDLSDNEMSVNFTVEPPPLPNLEMVIEELGNIELGELMQWNLNVSNIGDFQFNGLILCDLNGDIFYSETKSIETNSFIDIILERYPVKGILSCSHNGTRTIQTTITNITIDLESAFFLTAGSPVPVLGGGPWHAGDTVSASMLVRNEGEVGGSVQLVASYNGNEIAGDEVRLESGQAGEVSLDFQPVVSGNLVIEFSLESQDAVIEAGLESTLELPILQKQSIDLLFKENGDGNTIQKYEWQISLSSGNSRMVQLEFGYLDGVERIPMHSMLREINPGIELEIIDLGDVKQSSVYAQITPLEWSPSLDSILQSEITSPIQEFLPTLSLTLSTPPSQGQKVPFSLSIVNDGNSVIPSGILLVTGPSNEILFQVNTEFITTEDKVVGELVWPKGETVTITAQLLINGQTYKTSLTENIAIVSDASASTSESSFSWQGPVGGLTIGIGIILFLRILQNRPPSETKPTMKKKKPSIQKSKEKVIVHCPNCEIGLNVPSDYSGKIRCPDCETQFETSLEEQQETDQSDDISQESSIESEEETPWSSSNNDILDCPKCNRAIKVPLERRPAKAKCPHCALIFEARED